MDKVQEILEELRTVLAGRRNLLDSLLPPVLFVLLNALWGMQAAIWASLGLAVLTAIYRLVRGQSLLYALGVSAAWPWRRRLPIFWAGRRAFSCLLSSQAPLQFFSAWLVSWQSGPLWRSRALLRAAGRWTGTGIPRSGRLTAKSPGYGWSSSV